VKTNFAFLLETYKIAGDKLSLIDEKVEKAPWPPKKA
jgi:hypothetical protein